MSWATSRHLGDVVNPTSDRHKPVPTDEAPYLSMEHVESDTTRIVTHGRTGDMRSSTFAFKSGDVLYGRLRPYLNKVCIPPFDGFASTEFYVLRPSAEILGPYLLYYLNQPEVAAEATRLNQGDRPRVKWDQLARFEIPLPPIDEQRRIVEAIETHLSHLDAGVESLVRAKGNVERMRVALLRAAVEGRLMPHRTEIETSEDLLGRILEERQQTWQAIGRRGVYRDPIDVEPLAPMPDHWEVAAMDALAFTRLGKMLSKKATTGTRPRPYLRNQNVQWGRFDLSDVAEMDILPDEDERYRLRQGDLLVCEGGEVARCAIWDQEDLQMYYQKALHRVRPYKGVMASWLALVLQYLARSRLLGEFVTGSTIDHLPQEDLRAIPVPLPPPDEQVDILWEVGRQMSLLDALEREVEISAARAAKLRAAILGSAFSGDLVPGGGVYA